MRRQPVHTVYGGAHLFKAGTIRNLGKLALRSLQTYGANPLEFAAAIGFSSSLAVTRRSYGFRTYKAMEMALYHNLGRLPEPESTHRF